MKNVIVNEWKALYRNQVVLYLILLFVFALSLVTWLSILQNKKQIEAQKKAHQHIRAQWDNMKPTNPHSAGHFGSYAFKPNTLLQNIDEGVNAVTGNVIRLEAHVQNDVVYSETSQSLLISKFGKLKPSLLFQLMIPLLLIFLSFNIYTKEREANRLKLLLVQGTTLKTLITAKILSIWILGIALLFFAIFVQSIFNLQTYNTDSVLRLVLLFLMYGIYYFIITSLTVLISVLVRNSTTSLGLTIAIWVIWTVFLPKIAGNAVEKLTPLPTRVELQKAMDEDRSKGIDGHNPSGQREKELEKATLKKYNVDSLSQLPINFDGLVMQADEEYGNMVWDKHFGKLHQQLRVQKRTYQITGIINPFASLQNISMASSGTDMLHHLDFLKQAENYRRTLIKTLNDKHAYGGSKTGDWDWKPDSQFFKSIKDFQYQTPALNHFLPYYLVDILFLVLWAIVLLSLTFYLSKKVPLL